MRAKDLVIGGEYHYTKHWGRATENTGLRCRVLDNRPVFSERYDAGIGGFAVSEGGGKDVLVEVESSTGAWLRRTLQTRNIDKPWADFLAEKAQAAREAADREAANRRRLQANEELLGRVIKAAEAAGVAEELLLLHTRPTLSGDKHRAIAGRGRIEVGLSELATLLGVQP